MFSKGLKIGLILFLLLFNLTLQAASAESPADDLAVMGKKTGFLSRNPINFQQLIAEQELPPQPVSGYLSMPKVNGKQKVPAVILMPASGGIKPWYEKYIKNLNQEGIATFIVDSFTTRGITRLSSDQAQLPVPMLVADAYSALQYLAKEPAIDSRKIGIMGWSLGGLVSITTAFADLNESLLNNKLHFAAHVSFYPPCNLVYPNHRLDGAPWLYLHGGADDYAQPTDCLQLITNMRNSTLIQTVIYPDKQHGFDEPYPLQWLAQVQNPKNCYGILSNDWALSEKHTGTVINTQADYQKAYSGCMLRGGHVGFDKAASDDAMWQTKTFLKRYL